MPKCIAPLKHPTRTWRRPGYVESKYKFRPRWYAAARLDAFQPSNMKRARPCAGIPGARRDGIGFRPSPRVLAKAVVQMNRFDGNESLDEDHYMVQLSTRF
jgi:hypothetical protein